MEEKSRVPSRDVVELANVNVLLVGHEGAGMSTLFRSFLKLGKKDKSSQSRVVITMCPICSVGDSGIAILVISGAENDPPSDEEKMKQIVQRVYLLRFSGVHEIVIVITKWKIRLSVILPLC